MATKSKRAPKQKVYPIVTVGSHLTVTEYADGRTELKWDDEALEREVKEATEQPKKKVSEMSTEDIYILLLEHYIKDLEYEIFSLNCQNVIEIFRTPRLPTKIYEEEKPYNPYKTCSKCGMDISGVMGYCCPQPNCPTGLGPVMCDTTSK